MKIKVKGQFFSNELIKVEKFVKKSMVLRMYRIIKDISWFLSRPTPDFQFDSDIVLSARFQARNWIQRVEEKKGYKENERVGWKRYCCKCLESVEVHCLFDFTLFSLQCSICFDDSIHSFYSKSTVNFLTKRAMREFSFNICTRIFFFRKITFNLLWSL